MKCPSCKGTGWEQVGAFEDDKEPCPNCYGTGIDLEKVEDLPDESTAYGNDCPGGKCEM